MAVKAKPVDTASLSVLDNAQMGFNPMVSMVEPERGSFLPTMKLVHPVEVDLVLPVCGDDGKPIVRNGKPVTESAAGRVVLQSGKGKIEQIKAPYILTAYTVRGATRKLVEKDGKKVYERTYAKFDGSESSEKHKAAMAEANDPKTGVMVGNVALAIVLPNDGANAACVCLMEMFRTQTKYWAEPLKQGMLFNKSAIRVTVEDHSDNMIVSGNGFKYYSYAKFNQWSQVALSDDQVDLVREALRANKSAADAWLKQED